MVSFDRGLILVVSAFLSALSACQTREERERVLTDQCKQEAPCKKQGLCTGLCSPEPCRCVVGSAADCAQSEACLSRGECTVKDGKCIIGSNEDCAKTAACKGSGFCTAKEGVCVVASNADCAQAEICKGQHKCVARSGTCTDASQSPALFDPALAGEAAPEKFKVKFSTTKGDFTVEVTRAWGPLGAERLFNLVKIGYYSNVAVFKADDSDVHFGIHGNPDVTSVWRDTMFRDDPPKQPNDRGMLGFAKAGPHSRWAPLFIHKKGNRSLDQVGYAPIGRVLDGMAVVDALGVGTGTGTGPDPVKLQTMGENYLKLSFPTVDYVKSAELVSN